jgi:hypothetical protein
MSVGFLFYELYTMLCFRFNEAQQCISTPKGAIIHLSNSEIKLLFNDY